MLEKNYDDMLSRFHLTVTSRTNGQTDKRTNSLTHRCAISIAPVSMLTRDKKLRQYVKTF